MPQRNNMARKKKKKSKGWFGFGSSPTVKKTRRRPGQRRIVTIAVLKPVAVILIVVLAAGGIAVGLRFLEGYVRNKMPVETAVKGLELVSPPLWVDHQLDDRITDVVGDFLTEGPDIAETVAGRLQNFAWLYNVKVRTTPETVQISASYRLPVALVNNGREKYYLSLVAPDDLRYEKNRQKVVVLDYMDIATLPIIEIKGFASRKIPPVGSIWESEDVTTTAELLGILARMDDLSCKDKPLLGQFSYIDVSNFDGRISKANPHVVLCAKDGTDIRWGAAYGKSTLFVETKEQEKLATLYTFYKENNHSLQCRTNNVCQSVELRFPRKEYPRPEP